MAEPTLKEIYNKIEKPDKVSYEAWLRSLRRYTQGNVRTTRRVQRALGVTPPDKHKQYYMQDFLAYDGEGYDNKYVLLANSFGERIINPKGLTTEQCLEFLTRKYDKPTKRVWFGFSYDINMILVDIADADLLSLLSGNAVTYKGYTIRYIPSKIFIVNNYRHYDVFSFFATNFINTVERMLGEDRISKQLVEGKLARGSFDKWDIEDLIKYNDEELQLLVEIMNKLRNALLGVNVRLTEWYGPGAIAKYWFKKNKVKIPSVPASIPLYKALQSAYYGGRFEQFKLGKFKSVYEYDIRSAYPSVMSTMPAFTNWRKVKGYANSSYSIWHVTFDVRSYLRTGYRGSLPLPVRSKSGHICFPAVGKGWYWNDELRLLLDNFPKAKVTIHEGYVATPVGTPFSWITQLYNYRAQLKEEGNLSHYAIKVGLNSLYGKTAQTVGSNVYHSLAWAGYITSSTRTKIASAGYSIPQDSLIGFATDAVFSTEPIDLPISPNLGDWEESHFISGIFFQSGVYRLERSCDNLGVECRACKGTGVITEDRYRGSPLRRGIDDIIAQLKRDPTKYPSIKIARFISHLLAIKDPKAYGPHRLEFVNVPHELQIDVPYKRHYMGFIKKFDFENQAVIFDYAKMLREPIKSLPKIWVNDVNPFHWEDNLSVQFSDEEISSLPANRKDTVLQQLIEEGNIAAFDSAYTDVEQVGLLPIVEDDAEG